MQNSLGQQLVDKLLPLLDRIQWQGSAEATLQGRQTYEVCLEKVDTYRGDPRVLADAIRLVQTSDSLPFAWAGVAYILVAASREANGRYAPAGLEAALRWLEKAQQHEPDLVSINVLEALIYIFGGRLRDARVVLDYLENQEPDHYLLIVAETFYWQHEGDLDQTVAWFKRAIEASATVPQRLRLRGRLGDFYFGKGLLDSALAVYKEAIHFDQQNPMLWHNLSVIYWRQENFQEAIHCNAKALTLADFPAARQLEADLKRKMGTGMLRRLIGR